MMKLYTHTIYIINEILSKYKQSMMDFENKQTSDYSVSDIKLIKISSSVEQGSGVFWFSMVLQLVITEIESGTVVAPTNSRYYIKTTPTNISLYDERTYETFTDLWNTPKELEHQLIVAIFKDMLLVDDKCLQSLTKEIVSKLINDGFISLNQFSYETKKFYFDLFGIVTMLPIEVQDTFIF